MCSRNNIAAFSKIEEGKSVFLPIAHDSLISEERFMADLIEGLQTSLDLDRECDVSTLSGFDQTQFSPAARGNATPPRPGDISDMESPIGIYLPSRQLGSIPTHNVQPMGSL